MTSNKPRERKKMKMNNLMQRGIALALCVSLVAVAAANDQIPGAPQRRPIAIVGATIHPVDGDPIANGTLVFAEGRIVALGKAAKIPAKAKRVDAEGKHLYPGLFSAHTDLGLREINSVRATLDARETGRRNPNVRAWVAVNPDSELIPVSRSNGVLTALVAPAGSWLRGQAAVMHLDGWTPQEMLVRGPAGLVVDWEAIDPRGDESEKRAAQREARLQELDDLLDQVRRYRGIRQAEPERGIFDVRLEALIPVVEGTLPVIADADRLSAIESAVSYAVANDLQLIILGGYDAGACAGLLKRHEIPVIVAGTHRLPRRRHEPYDHAYTLPARLQAAGVRFCIASERPGGPSGTANVRNLPYHAATAVAFGLSPQQALRAITLAPAEILGVAEQTGSLTIGKAATLIVTDGDILQTETAVEQAWIAGRKVDLDNRHKQLYRKYQQKYQRR